MIREIIGLAVALAGLVGMIVGLVEAGASGLLVFVSMVVGTAGMLLAIHAGPLDDDDQDSFDEGVDAPN